MNIFLLYSGSQEGEDTVWGVYDGYADVCDNARTLMDKIFKMKFYCVDTNYIARWESESGHYHIYIDEMRLNESVLD